jgi:hypothetical protein
MLDFYEGNRVSVKVSQRDLKFKDGDTVTVNKIVDGKSVGCGNLIFSDVNYLLDNNVTQEELNILGCQMYLVKAQNFVRQQTKAKTVKSQATKMLTGLTDDQLEKVIALTKKLQS